MPGTPELLFPRRLVTRPPSAAENNIEISADDFARRSTAGGFALNWTAHGQLYAIAAEVDEKLREGRHAICNLSRSVVPQLHKRYAAPLVIEVTASPEILAARLGGRARRATGRWKDV